MAVDKGVFSPGELIPAPCGLLGVAEVHYSNDEESEWVRSNFSVENNARPQAVRLRTLANQTVANGDIYVDPNAADPNRYDILAPFFIEISDKRTALGILGEDRFARALEQLDAISQKSVEYELWTGAAARVNDAANAQLNSTYLTRQGTKVVSTGALPPKTALAMLEQEIAIQSPTGGSGVIHMTRDVASSIMGVGSGMSYQTDERGFSFLITSLGTPVVVGSGYTGAGPTGAANAAPTAANKWAFVTGPVSVFLGEKELINENMSQGFNSRTNDMSIVANRPAAVYFDPSIHAAARVAIPDVS